MKNAVKPKISPNLLWEYDFEKFNFLESYKLVIERIIQRGTLEEWYEMYRFYGKEKIVETLNWSSQLNKKDKNFGFIFLKSNLLHAIS